jgi:assimilatory nitrate reductase electron transfer subunit
MRVVIVGYGMAGVRFAADLRATGDADVKVTVLGAEPYSAYNRILLSSVLAGKNGETDVLLPTPSGLDVRIGVTAASIDRARRTVSTVDGDVVDYDHLVLATGSRAIVPPLAGLSAEALPPNLAVFRTLGDCRRILSAASRARTALVLGGGLLGLEAARGLAARGIATEVVHAVGHLMERQLDQGASAVLVRTLTDLGIGVHLGASAVSVTSDAGRVSLGLADGRSLEADLLVVACGVRPETGLAAAAGLTVNRGIVVDDRLRTSDRTISAIGDCAEHDGVVGGLVAPAWEQGRVLSRILTGVEPLARYRPVPAVTRLKASGIDLAAMGAPSTSDGPEEEVCFADPGRRTYAKLVIRDNRLAGAIMLGDNPAVGQVIQLFDRGATLPPDRRALLLGRGGPGSPEATDSPALMPDAATVCHCNGVTKGAVVRAIRAGARDVADVVDATRATTGCGTCREAVSGIVAWMSTVEVSA